MAHEARQGTTTTDAEMTIRTGNVIRQQVELAQENSAPGAIGVAPELADYLDERYPT